MISDRGKNLELFDDQSCRQLFPQEKYRSEGNCHASGVSVGRERMQPGRGGPLQKAVKIIWSRDQVTGDSCFVAQTHNLEFDLNRESGVGRECERGF